MFKISKYEFKSPYFRLRVLAAIFIVFAAMICAPFYAYWKGLQHFAREFKWQWIDQYRNIGGNLKILFTGLFFGEQKDE